MNAYLTGKLNLLSDTSRVAKKPPPFFTYFHRILILILFLIPYFNETCFYTFYMQNSLMYDTQHDVTDDFIMKHIDGVFTNSVYFYFGSSKNSKFMIFMLW